MDINGHTPLYEDYVSFETAKLLKEKGFDLHDANELYIEYKDGYCVINNPRIKHYCTDEFPKATHQMVMKWLREVHNIHIYTFYANGWIFAILDLETGEEFTRQQGYSSEEAVEAAIKYCLINLIK